MPGISLGVKRTGRETDRLPPSSAEVNYGGAIPSCHLRLQYVVAMDFSNFPRDTVVSVDLIARLPLSVGAESTVSAGVRAASNAYPDREVLDKTTIHRLAAKLRDTGSVYDSHSAPHASSSFNRLYSPQRRRNISTQMNNPTKR